MSQDINGIEYSEFIGEETPDSSIKSSSSKSKSTKDNKEMRHDV